MGNNNHKEIISENKIKNINESSNKKFIIIMRHGERNDYENIKDKIFPKDDPKLTKKGIEQALNIGKKLNETLFNKLKINEINIFSSPFTRTLMTGIYTCNSLNKNIIKNLYLIKNLSEYGIDINFQNNKNKSPISFFINEDNNYKKLWNEYIIKPTQNYNYNFYNFNSSFLKIEDINKINDNFNNVMKGILNYSSKTKGNSINFVVSHHMTLCCLIEECFNIMGIDMSEFFDEFHIGFCSTYVFVLVNEKLKYLRDLKPDF